jgi:hypothetical protein
MNHLGTAEVVAFVMENCMTDQAKDLLDVLLITFNSLFALAAFVMTLFVNARNLRIENRLKSAESFLEKERDLRVEAKRMARDKSLAILTSVDAVFEKLKTHDESKYDEINRYLRISLRKEYFDVQIYLPNGISDAIYQFLASCIRALGNYSIIDKYWDTLEEVAAKYTILVTEIRKTFYFETTDLSPMVSAEIAKFRPDQRQDTQ